MTRDVVVHVIDARPGVTAAELAERFACPEAVIRNVLVELIFTRTTDRPPTSKYMVTCDEDGRYFRGDPQPLYDQGAMR
jgi:hypothetical protein